jgi:hypothetical protein
MHLMFSIYFTLQLVLNHIACQITLSPFLLSLPPSLLCGVSRISWKNWVKPSSSSRQDRGGTWQKLVNGCVPRAHPQAEVGSSRCHRCPGNLMSCHKMPEEEHTFFSQLHTLIKADGATTIPRPTLSPLFFFSFFWSSAYIKSCILSIWSRSFHLLCCALLESAHSVTIHPEGDCLVFLTTVSQGRGFQGPLEDVN